MDRYVLNGKEIISFVLIVGIATGLSVPVLRSFEKIRHEAQVKTTLLEIQHALQDWHVEEEVYPRQSPMTGSELIGLLFASGHFQRPPHNPWTGSPFQPSKETEQTDRIRYSTDELAETYSLKALHRDSDEIFLELDSTEHQSLE